MGTTPLALPVETKMTGRQPAGEAVRGAVLSTRSYSAGTYAGARYAETGQQHGRTAGAAGKVFPTNCYSKC